MLLKIIHRILNVIRNNKYLFIAIVFALMVYPGTIAYHKWYNSSPSGKYENFKTSVTKLRMALLDYSQGTGSMPLDARSPQSGKPMLSWRHMISPLFEGGVGGGPYYLDEPWDSPNHLEWLRCGDGHGVYCFPHQENRTDDFTNIMAITGPGTAFDPDKPTDYFHCPHNLIILAYVDRSQTHWMQPGDIQIGKELTTAVEAEIRSKMYFDGGVIVGFRDREVWHLSKDIPVSVLFKFMTYDEYVYHSREKELSPYTISNYTREDMMKKANE